MSDTDPPADSGELDTTDGTRDTLTTDDGLAEAAADMPEVEDDEDGQDGAGELVAAPGLDVDEDGTDPLAGLAQGDDDAEGD